MSKVGAPFGNRNAKRGTLWRDALERALARVGKEGDRRVEVGLDEIAEATVTLARTGERWAVEEVGNRIDGKSVQPIAGSDEHPPLQVEEIRIVGIDPK